MPWFKQPILLHLNYWCFWKLTKKKAIVKQPVGSEMFPCLNENNKYMCTKKKEVETQKHCKHDVCIDHHKMDPSSTK